MMIIVKRTLGEETQSLPESKMTQMWRECIIGLVVAVCISSTAGQRYDTYGRQIGNPCSPSPCGSGTQCQESSGRPVCSCLPGHHGNPLTVCTRGECQSNGECSANKACKNNECVNVCAGICGQGANCEVKNHVPVCSCPPGYTGNSLEYCRRMDPQELCTPSPCGINTVCRVVNEVPTCSCQPGFRGSPLAGCKHECESDYDCADHQKCDQNFMCKAVCDGRACGTNANCQARSHRAICTCPENYLGDPLVNCRTECTYNSDCPSARQACQNNRCIDPCVGVCGVNANCEVRPNTATAVCSCPKTMTGDPFKFCRPFEKTDLCDPNPCGQNAKCQPGHDSTGKERPVCTCQPGYLGDALTYCRRGECATDNECQTNKACIDYNCQDPCRGQCGSGATCTARQHIALCACPPGTSGDASVNCYPVQRAAARAYNNRYYNKK